MKKEHRKSPATHKSYMCDKVFIHQLISPTPRGNGNCHYNLLTLGKSVESSACIFSIFKKRKEKNANPVKLSVFYRKTIYPDSVF